MEDDQKKKGKEHQHDCGEIIEARDTGEKFGKEKIRGEAKDECGHGGKQPKQRILFSQSLLANQLTGEDEESNAQDPDDDLNFDQHLWSSYVKEVFFLKQSTKMASNTLTM